MDDATVRPSNPLLDTASQFEQERAPPDRGKRDGYGSGAPPSTSSERAGSRASYTVEAVQRPTRQSAEQYRPTRGGGARSPPPPPPTQPLSPRWASSPPSTVAASWRTASPSSPTATTTSMSAAAPRRLSTSPTLTRAAGPPHAQSVREQPTPSDLSKFEQLCHRLYYDKDPLAARQVDQTLSKLPAGFRTAYARAMANVRSAFHRDEEVRRRKEVEHHLASCAPASSIKTAMGVSPLSEPSTKVMRSRPARRIRADKLRAFLVANCVEAMPGTHPFFRGLFAALWLQTQIPGPRCVEWEVDVAVFTEAGSGEAWAREADELLKGVLGMSERIKRPPIASTYADSTRTSRLSTAASDHSTSASTASETLTLRHSQPVTIVAPVVFERPTRKASAGGSAPPPPVPPHRGSTAAAAATARNRAPSDPFLDNKAALLSSDAVLDEVDVESTAASPTMQLPLPLPLPSPSSFGENGDTGLASPTASTPFLPHSASSPPPSSTANPLVPSRSSRHSTAPPPPPSRAHAHTSTLPSSPAVPPQFRIFTLPPYLTNPELLALLRHFPSFIAAPVRRAAASGKGVQELEEKLSNVVHGEVALAASGEAEGLEGGTAVRNPGWKGTLWERLIIWLRRLFGLA
ncbi:hypothetical protein JCM10908_007159 [Rhodotorula pacifica]|uniref:uncharacterized protein n=1 Tax=Rhodotorula pacifica TaxID=1495444 RepID=UPI00317F5993